MNQDRLNKILARMECQGMNQMILTDPTAIFYLLGKWILPGERLHALYLNTEGEARLVLNRLFPQEQDLGVSITYYDDTEDGVSVLNRFIREGGVIGVDKNWPARFLLRLQELSAGSRYVNGSRIVDKVRQIKDPAERRLMKESALKIDEVVGKLIPWTVKGLTERELNAKCLELIREVGFSRPSFEPITAYGKGAADPHHITDDSRGRNGDCALLDIGGMWRNYASDTTRTVFIGEVSPRHREIYEVVREANRRGIEAAKAGNRMCDVDKAGRDYIASKGFGEYFTHRIGHSIGLEDHEVGDVSLANEEIIEVGQCFSVEPGIYIPEEGIGVRIEDIVCITDRGCDVLNESPKDLMIVPD
ncbi:MAG: aminopeptidase P family protein [Oscillospiraceae bacterium]|nr:aminopeptidase P family protein [Oscillospiraceae bacterium]